MIKIDGVWKQYKLGNTIDLNKTFREVLTEKFSRKSQANLPRSKSDFFWALQDINLSIQGGRTLGLIGHNGAGKSTLLKILSRITKPTRGQITIHGSLSSLLEVGTGFHPELSGRENIYLYGSIMGMSRRDIDSRFEQIVDYAGIEQFLETPVKRYSSGMYVRLAFSIAAHVEPDILVVDEVLAVGDAAFREKCLGKMENVAESGRTVIFVSHNMNAVASLCQDVAWLDRGKIRQVGNTNTVVSAYENSLLSSNARDRAAMLLSGNLKDDLCLESLEVQGIADTYTVTIRSEEAIVIRAHWSARKALKTLVMNIALYCGNTRLMSLDDIVGGSSVEAGNFTTEFIVPANTFRNADLSISIGGRELGSGRWCWANNVAKINSISTGLLAFGSDEDAMMTRGEGRRLL